MLPLKADVCVKKRRKKKQKEYFLHRLDPLVCTKRTKTTRKRVYYDLPPLDSLVRTKNKKTKPETRTYSYRPQTHAFVQKLYTKNEKKDVLSPSNSLV